MPEEQKQEEKQPTPYREIRHYFMFADETWQATLGYAKKEAEFAPPDTMVVVHKHESQRDVNFGICTLFKAGCKILKS